MLRPSGRPILTLLLALGLPLAFPRAGSAGVDVWTQSGPEKGIFTRLNGSPDGRVIFAHAQTGGVFRSVDGGDTFFALLPNIGTSVSEATLDPRRPGRVWLGAPTGAYRSDDYGVTYQAKNVGLVNPAVYRVDYDPHDPNRLWATTSTRVFVSSDGGESWSSNGTGPTLIRGLAADPARAGRVWVIANNTADPVWRSDDGGATWAPRDSGLPSSFPYGIAIDPTNADRLWVSFPGSGIYRTEDGGASWTKPATTLPPNEIMGTLAIAPTNPPRLFVHSRLEVWQSDDRGASFTATGIPLFEIQRVILAGPNLWAVGVTGVYRRAAAGGSWEHIESGLSGISARLIAIGADTGVRYLPANQGIFRDRGTGWEDIGDAVGTDSAIAAAAAPGATEDVLFGTFGGPSQAPLYRNSGNGWTGTSQGLAASGAVSYLTIETARPQVRWAAQFLDVYRSTDGGASWTKRSSGLPGASVGLIVPDPRANGMVYTYALRAGLFRSSNDGASWSLANSDLDFDLTTMGIDPQQPDRIYAGEANGKVYRSEDRGTTWTTGGSLGSPVVSLLADPRAGSNVLYGAAFGTGFFRSTDRGATWTPMNEGLGNLGLSGVAADLEGQALTLHASTSTSGVFTRTVSTGALNASVDFTSSPTQPSAGEAVHFTSTGVPTGARVAWDFGDGAAVEGANPQHVFPGAGTYQVTLRVGVGAQAAAKTRAVTVGAGGGGGEPCVASATVLCVRQGRFRSAVDWKAAGNQGPGTIVTQSGDSGLFWFFSPDNWELMVKVLDGCGLNSRYWVFSAATTNVEYTLRVTDTTNGAEWSYHNPAGTPAPAITDTGAFATCP